MADLSLPARDSVAAQVEMFRRAKEDEGLSQAVLLVRDKHLRKSTLRDWANGAAAMPAWAIGALGEAGVPDHLLTLVTAPWSRSVRTDEETDADLDDAADAACEVADAVRRARHPSSPGGTAIVHTEKANIIPIARRAKAKLAKVAA